MKQSTAKAITLISFNTAVLLFLFLIKFILIPRILSAEELRRLEWGSSYLAVFLFWVPIPLISIVGMIIEQHLRYWLIPDFVYCAVTYLYSAADQTYGIGVWGFMGNFRYEQRLALADRLATLAFMLLLQLVVKLIIMLVKKIRSKKTGTQ